MRVLVIEDDQEMAETVAAGLRRVQMAVDVALDGPAGLERALVSDYDVIVLDRDLPGLHGDEVCGRLVDAGCRSRVLMLTAAAAAGDLVQGLGLGADDYLSKPFDFSVLVARIGALFRRAQPAIPPVLRCGDLALDTARRSAWRAGRRLDLAPKEFGVLELLLAAQGRVVPAEELLERVWDENADPFTTTVKVTLSRVRAKLGEPPLIDTVSRSGYRIGPGPATSPGRLAVMTMHNGRPRPTVRLRLSLWYGSLFLLSGAALLAVTYGLVVEALVGNAAGNAVCRRPGGRCHAIGSRQARAMAVSEHAAVLHELLSRSAIALAVMAALSIALGWFIAGRVLRPLRIITAAAREISAASLGDRLALGGPDDELRELGDTFDGLLARLEASFGAQRQFAANAAHELRTPLARQRIISQVALADPGATIESLRAAHERVLASGAEQQQLIDALLTLAQGQAGPDRQEPFDLAALTRQVIAAREAEARFRQLDMDADLGRAPAAGSPRLAERLAANLVDNALRHNVPGGRVGVSTRTRDGHAVLSVANTGPAVPVAAVDRLFQPFQRLGTERTHRGDGLGLGLSIARAIAETHGASITACPQPGGGLVVEVTFPEPGPAPMSSLAASGLCE